MKFFTPFIIIGICIIAYYAYISPMFVEVSALADKKAEYADALVKSKELADRRDSLLVAYNQISPEDIDRLKKIIPDTADNVALVTEINTLAASHGLAVRSAKVTMPTADSQNRGDIAAPVKSEPYKTLSVSVILNGQYDRFVVFLRDLESSVNLADVKTVSIKADGKQGSGSSLEYTLDVYTYSLH